MPFGYETLGFGLDNNYESLQRRGRGRRARRAAPTRRAFRYGKAVKIKTISTVKSRAGLEKIKHAVGKIYTVISKLKPRGVRNKIKKSEFNKIVSGLKREYAGKAKLLHVGINEKKKELTVQYTPIASFWVWTLPAVFSLIATLVVAVIGFIIIFSVLYIGVKVIPKVAGTLAGITPLLIVGGLALGGYLIVKKPGRVTEIARGAYGAAKTVARDAYGAAKFIRG